MRRTREVHSTLPSTHFSRLSINQLKTHGDSGARHRRAHCRIGLCRIGVSSAVHLVYRKQQSAWRFQVSDHIVQESGGGAAVNQAMIVRQTKWHHQSGFDGIVWHYHWKFTSATNE